MGVPYEQAVATVQLWCADLYDVPLGASRRRSSKSVIRFRKRQASSS